MRRRLYRAIDAAEWSFLAKERISHLIKALGPDIDNIAQGTFVFLQIPALAALAAVQLIIAFDIAPGLSLAVVVSGAALAALVRLLRGDTYQASKRTVDARRRFFDEISDFLGSLKLAKSHNMEARNRLAFEAALDHVNQSIRAINRRAADSQLLAQLGAASVLGAFVYVGAEFSHLSAPALLVMVAVFARLMPGLIQLQNCFHSLSRMLPQFDEVERLIARCDDAKETQDIHGTDRMPFSDRITVSALRFRYDKQCGPDVLADLDLEIPAGSITALVGPSGAGKSTFADLLMGLQVPDSGSISIDGQELNGAHRAAWRRSISYVPQENFLFHQSIRRNLQWVRPDATDDELHQVLKLTGAATIVASMPDGLDTVVGERGSRLSGGERQRLTLARALLRQPALLILDEATNALDHESEKIIWSILDRLRGQTTVVVIAHRLSRLRNADRIAVFEGGRIVQLGTWDELMREAHGRFALLVGAGATAEALVG
jgi:ATP-binding cassette subfamily C protein